MFKDAPDLIRQSPKPRSSLKVITVIDSLRRSERVYLGAKLPQGSKTVHTHLCLLCSIFKLMACVIIFLSLEIYVVFSLNYNL